ncbi:RNA-binding S4 domain-containing protein [Rikenella microfusus]|uniref:Heat shock protein 15 n=1 Tax=Rikenella microfusus TaxID=28139 RepID=A0A379MQN0_9BACT|nr:S4 domain-containing protein [Rikenella microfusus]SUE33845.1 Heat shock protein 15 [Rikenella microfusus]
MADGIRIDKWLWAVRLFKTRSDAAEACKSNRVLVNGTTVKPSREVRTGEVVSVRRMPVVYSFRILEPVANRQPAKNVPRYIEDVTPQEELLKLEMARAGAFAVRDRGMGRPTKKERRDIEELLAEFGELPDMETDE